MTRLVFSLKRVVASRRGPASPRPDYPSTSLDEQLSEIPAAIA